MIIGLVDTSVRLGDELIEKHRVNSVDAVDIFRLIWERMTGGPYSLDIEEAVTLIETTFDI